MWWQIGNQAGQSEGLRAREGHRAKGTCPSPAQWRDRTRSGRGGQGKDGDQLFLDKRMTRAQIVGMRTVSSIRWAEEAMTHVATHGVRPEEVKAASVPPALASLPSPVVLTTAQQRNESIRKPG